MTTPDAPPKALSHPLPAGMRDLLPEETRRRRSLARRILDRVALHGYRLVTPPAFELAEVLERGLGTLDPSDVLRFVEPESGEVAALRPDMTPQIARMVATRLGREPLPIRLCYEGTIVRRRQGRARRHRQVPQAGVELYGAPSPEGDLEVLRLAASAVRATGLTDFVVDLGHATIARTLLDPLPAPLAAEVSDALEQKDGARIRALLVHAPAPLARALEALPDLQGGGPGEPPAEALFGRARALFHDSGAAAAAVGELERLWSQARAADPALGARLRLDLGEVRGFAYYTGVIFHLLAEGPGEPIGAGGRYDDLLGRFDLPMPAVGFGLHLDAVSWALEQKGLADAPPTSVLVALGERSEPAAEALRAQGIAAAVHPEAGAEGYARAWRFTHLLTPAAGGMALAPVGAAGPGAAPGARAFGLDAAGLAAMVEAVGAGPKTV